MKFTENESTLCLKRIGKGQTLTLPQEENEYRVVQFGPSLESTMLNMTAFPFTMYLVIVDQAVKGEFADLQSAKAELNKYSTAASSPTCLVAEIINGKVQKDPHTVGGEDQSLAPGFNNFWRNKGHITRLIKAGQYHVDQPGFNYDMHGKWTHPHSLHARYINMRLYEESRSTWMLLCAVYNTYGISNDRLGKMKVKVVITGMDGQTIEWLVCDDKGE